MPPSSFLKYLDANNLYGWAKCKKLPYSSFKFLDPSYFDEDLIKNYDEDKSDYGFVFKVDIEYPEQVALKHEDIAFLPKRKKNGVEKLVTTLEDKENQVLHVLALKQAIDHGLKIRKTIHRVLNFKQKASLKSYIEMNNKHKMNAKNNYKKGFFKLMNNSVFGKTMENVRNHRDIKLVTTKEKLINMQENQT